MTSAIDKQAHELVMKQTELERAIDKASQSELQTKLVKAESKNSAEAAQAYHHQLQRSVLQNKQLEQKWIEARDKLAESEISQHKLRKMNESLRAGEWCHVFCTCNECNDTSHLCLILNDIRSQRYDGEARVANFKLGEGTEQGDRGTERET